MVWCCQAQADPVQGAQADPTPLLTSTVFLVSHIPTALVRPPGLDLRANYVPLAGLSFPWLVYRVHALARPFPSRYRLLPRPFGRSLCGLLRPCRVLHLCSVRIALLEGPCCRPMCEHMKQLPSRRRPWFPPGTAPAPSLRVRLPPDNDTPPHRLRPSRRTATVLTRPAPSRPLRLRSSFQVAAAGRPR